MRKGGGSGLGGRGRIKGGLVIGGWLALDTSGTRERRYEFEGLRSLRSIGEGLVASEEVRCGYPFDA